MFRGLILITGSVDVLRNINLGPMTRIINLDEDGILPEAPDIIGGTCLLPPIEAKIAEADGNEPLYDNIYSNHLLSDNVRGYIAALLCYLYKGGNLLLFLPDLGYTNTFRKILFFMDKLYGIHIGIVGDPVNGKCAYNMDFYPMWLDMIYSTRAVMDVYEYLYMYPENIPLINNKEVLGYMLEDLKPMGDTWNERINEILKFHKLIHKYPNARPVIERIL